MPTDLSAFGNIKRAYELLGVPDSASTRVIKHAYRVMAKRWHPDLYRAGTPEQAEAARMMEHINGTIQRAPLRYGTLGYTRVTSQQAKQAPTPMNAIPVGPEPEHFVAMDKLEFWVQFVCGSILGTFVTVGIALKTNFFSDTIPIPVLCVAIAIVPKCGFGAAQGGDRFWYAIFGR